MNADPPTPADTISHPPAEVRARPSRPALLYLATLLTLLLLRGLTAVPQADVPVRNMDEHLMFAVGVSSITGGPANTLGWPGGSMRAATTLLVPSVFAIEHLDTLLHRRRDVPREFVQFLGHELRDPWRMVGVLRGTSILLSSLGFACLPLILRRFTRSDAIAFAVSIVALCGGTLWTRSLMATGDAVGWATAVVGLWAAIRARESSTHWLRWTVAAALCAGLATASKLTAIYLWPLLFLAPLAARSTLRRSLVIWLVAAPLGHYLLNPYVLTDSVRFAKAVAGNLLTRGVNTPLATALVEGVPLALLIAAVASVPAAWALRSRWLILGTLGTIAMYALTIRRAAMIEPHYLAPLTIPLAMLAAHGFEWLARRPMIAARQWLVPFAAGSIACISIAFGTYDTRIASVAAANKYGPGQRAVRHLDSIGFAGRIAVEPSQSYHDLFIARIEHDDSIAARLARLEASVAGGRGVVAALAKGGIDPLVAAGLADAFNDSDRMKIANYRAMAVAGVTRGPTVVPVDDAGAGGAITRAAAAEALRRGEVDALLLAEPIDGLSPTRDFGGIAPGQRSVLYLRDATTRPAAAP